MSKRWNSMPDDNVARFIGEVRHYPLLERRAEAELSRRWRDHRDPDAADLLVGSHQRLVVKIAGEYRGYGLPLSDLISEGNVGLMQAVSKFDPDRGFRLSTYAMWWIRAAISDYILRNTSVVKTITNEHHKKLFFNLRRLKAKYQKPEENELSAQGVSAIAEELGVPESEIVLMDRRLGARDLSTNTRARSEVESDAEWQDFLVDPSEDQENRLIAADEIDKRRQLMREALAELDERERHILIERRLRDNPPKLVELSEAYGISRERVRQIEVRAVAKLGRLMRDAAIARGMLNGGGESGNRARPAVC